MRSDLSLDDLRELAATEKDTRKLLELVLEINERSRLIRRELIARLESGPVENEEIPVMEVDMNNAEPSPTSSADKTLRSEHPRSDRG